MRVVVPHGMTQEATIPVMDKALDKLLAGVGGSVQVVDQKSSWDGPVMTFSFTGKLGFVAVPMVGTILVEHTNVTVTMDLPPIVTMFIGEDKLKALVDENVRSLLRAGPQL